MTAKLLKATALNIDPSNLQTSDKVKQQRDLSNAASWRVPPQQQENVGGRRGVAFTLALIPRRIQMLKRLLFGSGRNAESPEITAAMHPRWVGILRGDSSFAPMQRMYRRMFAAIPSPWRCKFCNAPFKGPAANKLKWIGYSPSRKNPSICAR